ncbi:hypothetical protein Aduo_018929 [Ancylostoma duodenale]
MIADVHQYDWLDPSSSASGAWGFSNASLGGTSSPYFEVVAVAVVMWLVFTTALEYFPLKSPTSFANRLVNSIRAATTGEDPASQKGMVLEEFVDRLRSDIRPHVNLDNLATLEQDLGKAPKGEQLKAEATEARFISSATPPTSTEVKPMNLQPVHTTSQVFFNVVFRPLDLTQTIAFKAPVLQGYSMPIDEIVFLIKLHALTAVVLDILCDNALCPGFALRTEVGGLLFLLVVDLLKNNRSSSAYAMHLFPSDPSTELSETREQIHIHVSAGTTTSSKKP